MNRHNRNATAALMGRCYDFGVSIDGDSERAMIVAPEGGHCVCPSSGTTCHGRFSGCGDILNQPGRIPANAPEWSLDPNPIPVSAPTKTALTQTAPTQTAPTQTAPAHSAPAQTAPAQTAPAQTAPAQPQQTFAAAPQAPPVYAAAPQYAAPPQYASQPQYAAPQPYAQLLPTLRRRLRLARSRSANISRRPQDISNCARRSRRSSSPSAQRPGNG